MTFFSDQLHAVVPAAGVGRRMGGAIPKQYMPLAGTCILQVTLDKLLSVKEINSVVVALSPDDSYFSACVTEHPRLRVVTGGAERADSVLCGVRWVVDHAGNNAWVLVHDAARPCFSSEKLSDLLSAVAASQRGGLLAVPSADTLKAVENGKVVETVDRERIWMAHTPQVFRAGELLRALCDGLRENQPITDEASAMEMAGVAPLVIADTRENIKITTPDDLALAECILQRQGYSSLA